jgi:hypothetical protein
MDTDAEKALRYRHRAKRIRLIADGMLNPEARETLLQIAGNFERLAYNIEMELGVLPPEHNSGRFK